MSDRLQAGAPRPRRAARPLARPLARPVSRFVPRLVALATAAGAAAGLAASAATPARQAAPAPVFANPYVVEEDTGERVAPSYFLRRARVQLLRDLAGTRVPATRALDLAAMAEAPFAVAWLGHSAMLMRVDARWVLLDPALSGTAGPVPGFGPARLTALPIAPDALPRIDAVLISHDHYDHLDLRTLRRLAKQPGGPPRFLVGRGLGPWFARTLGAQAEEFDWWQRARVGEAEVVFVPAQHNSGRSLRGRNRTLWGGWVVEHAARRFYFAGDTSYVQALFRDIRTRLGPIDLAALPIGAYRPRALMRFDHTDPDDAVRAFLDLEASCAFGVHWGTFQLGDEEPFDAATDLAAAVTRHGAPGFGLLEIGGMLRIVPPAAVLSDATPSDATQSGGMASSGMQLGSMQSSGMQSGVMPPAVAAADCAAPPLQLRSTTAARSLGPGRPDR